MSLTSASILFILISIFIGSIFFYFVPIKEILPQGKSKRIYLLLSVLLLVLIGNGFVFYFSASEHYIYTWDYFTYWNKSIRFSVSFFYSPLKALKLWYDSVLAEDYAFTPCIGVAPSLFVFGKSYPSYVLAVFNTYYLPACLLYLILFWQLKGERAKVSFMDLFLFFLFIPLLSTVLYGYIDSVCLPFAAIFLLIAFKQDFSQYNWTRNVLLSLLMVLFLLERRWFTFWFVSFFVSMGMMYLMRYISEREEFDVKRLLAASIQLAAVVGGVLVILALFFHDFYLKTFFNKYDDIYSAYRSPSWLIPLQRTMEYFGSLFVLLALIGVYFGLRIKRTKNFTVFLLTHLVVTYALFTHFQDFGIHQYLLLASTWVVLAKIGLDGILSFFAQKGYRLLMQGIFAFLLIAQFGYVYVPSVHPYVQFLSFSFSDVVLFPRTRGDIPAIKDLVYYVQSISSCPRKKVYAIGSSGIFCDEVVQNLLMPKEYKPVSMLMKSRDVDKRDGFPVEALKADIFILAWPIQYHLRPEDQMTVVEIGKMVKNNSGPGKSFCQVNSFHLDNGVEAQVFEKVAPIPYDSIQELKRKFLVRYAQYPQLVDFGGF